MKGWLIVNSFMDVKNKAEWPDILDRDWLEFGEVEL